MKENLKRVRLAAVMLLAMVMVLGGGCLAPTQTVIEERDPATGQVIKTTTTSESVVKTVVDSTRDKWVLVNRQGWAGGIRVIPAGSSAENPTGCLEMVVGKEDSILSTMPMDRVTPETAATVIDRFTLTVSAARSGELSFDATGVSANNSPPATGADGK